jgi:hypothetical protein
MLVVGLCIGIGELPFLYILGYTNFERYVEIYAYC